MLWLGDWTYAVLIPGLLIAFGAQILVKSRYSSYSQQLTQSGITGQQMARMILSQNGLQHVQIVQVAGTMSDHYDPRTETVNLSAEVFNGTSIASVSIAAHECGHAVQHAEGYFLLKLRNAIVPVANLGTMLAFPLVFIGLIFEKITVLTDIGILLFAFAVLFQLCTLPVEINASQRAMDAIKCEGVMSVAEASGAKKMLTAAAMTYVAALLVTALQFLRLLLIASQRRR